MALNQRLKRLEATVYKPPAVCPYCGIEQLANGTGPVFPGWIVPETIGDPSGAMMLGCKSCFAWVKVKALPEQCADGAYHVAGAVRCGCPEYV